MALCRRLHAANLFHDDAQKVEYPGGVEMERRYWDLLGVQDHDQPVM